MKNNPYITTPGKIPPLSYIERPRQIDDIVDEFNEDYPSNQIFKIKGIRGTGKTVALREIGKQLMDNGSWIVANLNVEEDMMAEFYDKLVLENKALTATLNTSVSVNIPVSLSYKKEDAQTYVGKIQPYLESIKKRNKKILITVDEIFDNDILRSFISQCQIWVGENYPIYLITAGLYNNYEDICAHRNMTFFKRAPSKELDSLDTTRIIDDYTKNFHLNQEDAEEMAKLTKGYAYAFQLLGYICWKENKPFNQALDEFDKEIDNNAYQLIWKELSSGDKKTLLAIAKSPTNVVKDIREKANVSAQSFQQSKDRLLDKKLISNDERGIIEFVLPRFKEFVLKAERLY